MGGCCSSTSGGVGTRVAEEEFFETSGAFHRGGFYFVGVVISIFWADPNCYLNHGVTKQCYVQNGMSCN